MAQGGIQEVNTIESVFDRIVGTNRSFEIIMCIDFGVFAVI